MGCAGGVDVFFARLLSLTRWLVPPITAAPSGPPNIQPSLVAISTGSMPEPSRAFFLCQVVVRLLLELDTLLFLA